MQLEHRQALACIGLPKRLADVYGPVMRKMNPLDAQVDYWNREGPSKTFSHPIDWPLFESAVDRDALVVDYGCGYGRSLGDLVDRGYANVSGLDVSEAMVLEARSRFPGIEVRVAPPLEVPFPDGSVGAFLLIAVLTCIVTDEGQRALVDGLRRALAPGGVVFVSDMPLQQDERNVARYERDAGRFGTYGVFELSEGVVVRHHDEAWLDELFGDFVIESRRTVQVKTMNGNPASVVQFLARADQNSER